MRYSDQLKSEIDKKMMEAISSLKRAIGVSDHPTKRDSLNDNGMAHIYTIDSDSNLILSALFHQFVHGDQPVCALDKKGKPATLPRNFAYQYGENPAEFQETELYVPEPIRLQFIERIDDYIEKFIAPTGPSADHWKNAVAPSKAKQKVKKTR